MFVCGFVSLCVSLFVFRFGCSFACLFGGSCSVRVFVGLLVRVFVFRSFVCLPVCLLFICLRSARLSGCLLVCFLVCMCSFRLIVYFLVGVCVRLFVSCSRVSLLACFCVFVLCSFVYVCSDLCVRLVMFLCVGLFMVGLRKPKQKFRLFISL